MNVVDILTRKPSRIITVRQNETVATAAMIMKRENTGALVVKDVVRTEGNTPLGMFSERDIVGALVDHGTAALALPVGQLMTEEDHPLRPARRPHGGEAADGAAPHPPPAGLRRRAAHRRRQRARPHRGRRGGRCDGCGGGMTGAAAGSRPGNVSEGASHPLAPSILNVAIVPNQSRPRCASISISTPAGSAGRISR